MKLSKYSKTLIVTFMCGVLCWSACKREDRLDRTDDAAPAPVAVTNVATKSTPGGTVLTYTIPKDPNLVYIKAVYEIRPGVFKEAKSSYYKDSLELVGYGDTLIHEVRIFSVGKNEKESEAVTVKFRPLTPPVLTVFKDLELVAGFGGVKVRFKNESQANLALNLLVDSTGNGRFSAVNTFYTAAKEGIFSARGLLPVKKKYAIVLSDRWNNKSDTLKVDLTPLIETLIPRSQFSILRLPTDVYLSAIAGQDMFPGLFDGRLGWNGFWASSNTSTIPQWFTMDLSKKVSISRIMIHALPDVHLYDNSAVKAIEIWGSNSPNTDGSWESWTLMGSFKSFKPSGLPLGQVNTDDVNYANIKGEEFEFNNIMPPYRYIRLKPTESYSSGGQIVISEIDVYGQQ